VRSLLGEEVKCCPTDRPKKHKKSLNSSLGPNPVREHSRQLQIKDVNEDEAARLHYDIIDINKTIYN